MIVEDLFFATKISTAAQALGVVVEPAPLAGVLEQCRHSAPDLIIADLHGPGDVLGAVSALKAEETRSIPIVGFYSHVDAELREAALDAGVDQVLPRSAFTAKLAEILAGDGKKDRKTR